MLRSAGFAGIFTTAPSEAYSHPWYGQTRQSARSSDLLFDVPFLVSWLSRFTTLEPGDVISTGTPAGVGHPEGRYLGAGDTVEIQVERVLPLVNTLVA